MVYAIPEKYREKQRDECFTKVIRGFGNEIPEPLPWAGEAAWRYNRYFLTTLRSPQTSPNTSCKPFPKKGFGTFKAVIPHSRYGSCRLVTDQRVLRVARQF